MKSRGLTSPCLKSSTLAKAASSRSDEPAAAPTSSEQIASSRDALHTISVFAPGSGTIGEGGQSGSTDETSLPGMLPPTRSSILQSRVLSANARIEVGEQSISTSALPRRCACSRTGVRAEGESWPGFLSTCVSGKAGGSSLPAGVHPAPTKDERRCSGI